MLEQKAMQFHSSQIVSYDPIKDGHQSIDAYISTIWSYLVWGHGHPGTLAHPRLYQE
jgi:hypothetical protein